MGVSIRAVNPKRTPAMLEYSMFDGPLDATGELAYI